MVIVPFFLIVEEMIKKRIGIKYCGGCNPTYERVEMVEKIKFLVGGQFDFLPYDREGLDGLLLVQGCERACVLESLNPRKIPYLSVTKATEEREVVKWLEHFNEENDN